MRNSNKKIFGIVMALAMLGTTAAFAGCSNGGNVAYKGDKLEGYDSKATVESNGGFAVEKGDYVYFINGTEESTADNTYGNVVKGSLMRISKADLAAGDTEGKAQCVVPTLFTMKDASGTYTTGGVYIYGDYVYYATPTTDKTMGGGSGSAYVDFKSAIIDGTQGPMSDYYFRLSTGSLNYRFVTVDGVDENKDGKEDVFCMYEENSVLKSFNTATRTSSVLVSGAKNNKFHYNMKDLADPNVYYTMSVKYDSDTTAPYDQLYCVNAAAKVSKTEAANGKVSYTVKDGRTYSFEIEKEKKNSSAFDQNVYSTYSYVNLGTLVLDGIGEKSTGFTQYNNESEKDTPRESLEGFTYTVQRNENDGVYFTRTKAGSSTSKLYYLANARENWNTVSGNKEENLSIVAMDTTVASSTALFEINEGVHSYLYLSGSSIHYATAKANGEADVITVAYNVSGTLLKTVGDYVYYYGTGENGNSLSRVNYKGKAFYYKPILSEMQDEYKPLKVAYVDYDSSWYVPEFVDDVVLYRNAQSYGAGTTAYEYVYMAKLGSTQTIMANNEAYEAVSEYKNEYSSDAVAQAYIEYYFRTNGEISNEVKALYDEKYAKDNDGKNLLDYVAEKFSGEDGLKKETAFLSLVGKMNSEDAASVAEAWKESLLHKDAVAEEKGLETWAIVLIVIGSVLVVAAITVAVILIVKNEKRKAAEKREAYETANAYKLAQIDTTDDKSIDVYATEEPKEEPTETSVEETPAETSVEETVEEVPVEEAPTETPVEESKEEKTEE